MRADAGDLYGSGQGFRPGAGPGQGKPGQRKEISPSTRDRHPIERLALAALDSTPLSELIQHACDTVSQQLSVEYVVLLELSHDGQLVVQEGVGWDRGIVGNTTVSTGLSSQAGYTLLQSGPVLVDDLQHERRFHGDRLLNQHKVRSGVTVGVPSKDNEFCGTLGAHTSTPRSFTEEEAHFVTEVAKILGHAMEQRNLEGRARYAEERFGALVHASSLLAASTDYDAALAYAARVALDHLANWCFIDIAAPSHSHNGSSGKIQRLAQARDVAVEDAEGQPPKLRYDYLLETTLRHGTVAVLRSGQPEVISPVTGTLLKDIARDNEHLTHLHELSPGGYMCVPMQTRQRVIGSMGFVCGPDKHYQEEDLALASSLARYTALAVDSSLHLPEGQAVSGELTRRVKRHHEPMVSMAAQEELQGLSRRRLEVLTLLGNRKGAKEIAAELNVSEETAKSHMRALRQIFGARSPEVVDRARKLGLIPGTPIDGDGG